MRVFCNEVGVLYNDPPVGTGPRNIQPFTRDRWGDSRASWFATLCVHVQRWRSVLWHRVPQLGLPARKKWRTWGARGCAYGWAEGWEVAMRYGTAAVVNSSLDLTCGSASCRWWWNMEAAQYAYVYAELADRGVYGMAASQLTGYPGNAASISMLDWTNGLGNAWYWVLKMFIDTLGSGTKDVVRTTVATPMGTKDSGELIRALFPSEWVCIHSVSPKTVADAHVDPVYAKAMVLHSHASLGPHGCGGGGGGGTGTGQRVVLLANTKNSTANVTIVGAAGGSIRAVDMGAGYEDIPYSNHPITDPTGMVQIRGFAAAIVCMPVA